MKERFAVEAGSRRGEVETEYYGPFKTGAAARTTLRRKGWTKSFASEASDATEEEWVDPVPVRGDRSFFKVVAIGDLSRRTRIKPARLLPRRL